MELVSDQSLGVGRRKDEGDLKSSRKEMQTALKNINDQASECTSLITALRHKIEEGDISTDKGLSFLEVKNHLLLQYLVGICGVSLNKTSGESIQDLPYINQLIELRTVLEKIRPIDNKLKYQIDKLIRSATSGTVEADPLRHRANPDNLAGSDDSSDEDDDVPKSDRPKSDVYVPPKVAPQHYDGEEEAPAQKMEKAKKKFINKNLIREMQEEFLDTPVEIHNRGDSYSADLQRVAKEKQRFEENYMTRLPTTKREKHKMKSMSTIGVLGDEITDFTGKRSRMSNSSKSGNKRKAKGKKGSGGKKRFRK
ncbi:Neuroguidin [Orchesella cincta]|uniref:Neuroguidin n=1 Tax=Orchesella cincta TaxID=48709 RepID=A0A1D2N2V7_ORCCI|nr:Neuroguidin [Orchesella cincta]